MYMYIYIRIRYIYIYIRYIYIYAHIHLYDCCNFLHYKLAHPKALKDSIPYSQALQINRKCSETSDVINNLKDLEDAFIERGYDSETLDHHFERAMNLDREILLENKNKPSNLSLVLTYNKTLPNIKNVMDNNWHILSINENLRKVFDKKPLIAYRRNINLKQLILIGGNRIFKNKVVRKNTKQSKQSGHCSSCLSKLNNFCFKQVKQTKTFQSCRTKETFQIFDNLTCKEK